MKFTVFGSITAIAALLTPFAVASPMAEAPSSALAARDDAAIPQDVLFAFTQLFTHIVDIPESVLDGGDNATEAWLLNKADPTALTVLESDVVAAGGTMSVTGELEARASVWEITKCAAAVTVAVAPMAKALSLIKKLGGVVKAVKEMAKGAKASKVGKELALEILGISAVQKECKWLVKLFK